VDIPFDCYCWLVLLELNSTKMVRKFGMVENYDYPLEALLHVTNGVEQELTSVKKDFYQMVFF
jgi:hypothetical protein